MRAASDRSLIVHIIITTGVSSVVTQLLTIREFLAQFTGNEFIIALIFFSWLTLGGVGTLLANICRSRFFPPSVPRLAWLSLAIATIPSLQLLLIRVLRNIVFIPGSTTGFYEIFLYTFFTIAPYCILIGFVLPYSLFVLRCRHPSFPGTSVYILDNIGDTLGGAVFSFLLVFFTTPLQATLIVNLFLLAATWGLFVSARTPPFLFIPATLLVLTLIISAAVREKSTLIFPAEGELAAYQESRYGRILVSRHKDQHTLFFDGFPLASSHNVQSAEEAAHYPLLQVRSPRNILVISAVAGIMTEIRKHRPERIDYLEINPRITRAMFQFHLLEQSSNIHTIHRDARLHLATDNRHYDAIIMCLPDPSTFQLNRFYTKEFFHLVKSRLREGGVFSFSLEGFDNYLTETRRQKISSLYQTLIPYFRNIRIIPGGQLYFLCTDSSVDLHIPRQLRQKKIATRYLAGFFTGDVSSRRIAYVNNLLAPDSPVNRDLVPVLLRLEFADWFAQHEQSPFLFYGILAIFFLLYFIWLSRKEFVLFSTGFATMGMEVLTIFAFQIFFGYIYFQIGFIVTAFLAGLLPGAWLGQKMGHHPQRTVQTLDTALILLMATFIGGIFWAGQHFPGSVYLLFGFFLSGICGFQFPALLRWAKDTDKNVTGAFSADLIGAASGALLVSTLLIPYGGLVPAGLVVILLKAISLFLVRTTP